MISGCLVFRSWILSHIYSSNVSLEAEKIAPAIFDSLKGLVRRYFFLFVCLDLEAPQVFLKMLACNMI